MGKTYKRNSQYRPKKHGQIFIKDQDWKKNKYSKNWNKLPRDEPIVPDDIFPENPEL